MRSPDEGPIQSDRVFSEEVRTQARTGGGPGETGDLTPRRGLRTNPTAQTSSLQSGDTSTFCCFSHMSVTQGTHSHRLLWNVPRRFSATGTHAGPHVPECLRSQSPAPGRSIELRPQTRTRWPGPHPSAGRKHLCRVYGTRVLWGGQRRSTSDPRGRRHPGSRLLPEMR